MEENSLNELIKVNIGSDDITISGRELHKFLEVKTRYDMWFNRMKDYGFTENQDFIAIAQKRATAQGNETTYIDHEIKLDMAKEIAMIQRNDKGKQARQYFIQVDKYWNSPEMIMKRALEIANKQVKNLKIVNKQQEQVINELQPKATYYDLVLQNKDLVPISIIAKDYGMSGKGMNQKLHELKVQYTLGSTWLLYSKYQDKGYTSSKTIIYDKNNGTKGSKMYTNWTQKGRLFIYDLLKGENILPLIERE